MWYCIWREGKVMENRSTYKEIIRQIFLTYNEILQMKYHLFVCSLKSKRAFSDYEEMNMKMGIEVSKCLQSITIELKVLYFIFLNEKNLFATDIYEILDRLDENYEERFLFLEEIFGSIQEAIDMDLAYRFYIPKKKPKFLTNGDLQKYLNYVKGFNAHRLEDFILKEGIFDKETLLEILNQSVVLNVNASQFMDVFEIEESSQRLILPTIKNQLSFSINLHLFIKKALSMHQESSKSVENTLFSFYDKLLVKYNVFMQEFSKNTEEVNYLLENYNGEKFVEQLNKLKRKRER